MKTVEVDVIGTEVNAAVVKLPWRHFPGIVLQGDSLANLTAMAQKTAAFLSNGRTEDAAESAAELLERLQGYKAAYERAMNQAKLPLPYYDP